MSIDNVNMSFNYSQIHVIHAYVIILLLKLIRKEKDVM